MQRKRLSLNNALLLFDKEKKRVRILSYLKPYMTPIVPYPEIPTPIELNICGIDLPTKAYGKCLYASCEIAHDKFFTLFLSLPATPLVYKYKNDTCYDD